MDGDATSDATSDVESDLIVRGFSPDRPAPLLDGEGALVLACGHVAHTECHARYLAAAESRDAEGFAESRARVGLADGDFHCPTCRRMCNALVPIATDPPCRRRRVWDRGDETRDDDREAMEDATPSSSSDATPSSSSKWTSATLSRDARALDRDARRRAERERDIDRVLVSNSREDVSDVQKDRAWSALRRRLREASTEGPAAAKGSLDGDEIETDDGRVEWLAVVHGVAHAEVASRWRGDDVRGDDVRGDDVRGDDVRGDDVRGDDVLVDVDEHIVNEHIIDVDVPASSSTPSSSTRFAEPAAATAADSGRWRALRELTTLALSAGASISASSASTVSVAGSFEDARALVSWISGDEREGTVDRPDATSQLAILSDAFARARRKYWRDADGSVRVITAEIGGPSEEESEPPRNRASEEESQESPEPFPPEHETSLPEHETSPEDAPPNEASPSSSGATYSATLDELFRKDPPAFVAETAWRYARASPGVFTDPGGLARLDVIARVAVLAAVARAAAATADPTPSSETKRPETSPETPKKSDTPRGKHPTSSFDLFVRHLAPVFWRVEALLSLADGASTPPPSAHPPRGVAYPTRAARLAAATAAAERCGDRLIRRLGVAESARDAWRIATTRRLPSRLHSAWLAGVAFGSLSATSRSVATPHARPRLATLPREYENLYLKIADRPCDACGAAPRDPAVCLACGELVCCAGFCCRAGGHGESARHAAACGAGAGLFFLVKSTRTLLLRGRRACLYPSVYLDAHGEEDEFLKRGRPLFLSEERVAALEELWVQSAFDYDSLAAQNSRLGSDFY